MLGSEIIGIALAEALPLIPAVVEAVDDRVFGIDVVPDGQPTPALIHSPVSSSYGAPIGSGANSEVVMYQVRLVCEGQSTEPIWDAAEAQLAALDRAEMDLVVKDVNYRLTFEAQGETVPTTNYVSGTFHRVLGTVYRVHVVRG